MAEIPLLATPFYSPSTQKFRENPGCVMSLLLVVASVTLSHVTAIVFKVDEADDVSWSSVMVMEQILG